MVTKYLAASIVCAAIAIPASAQEKEIGYPEGSLAYEALMSSDYARAERVLKSDFRVRADDPAKLINLGLALAKTGRADEARRAFNQVLAEDEVELIMADGSALASHDVARRGLAMIK